MIVKLITRRGEPLAINLSEIESLSNQDDDEDPPVCVVTMRSGDVHFVEERFDKILELWENHID